MFAKVLAALLALTSIVKADEAPDPAAFKPSYEVGLRARYLMMPKAFMQFLDNGTSLNSASLGAEFVYRRRTFDIVTSVDFSFTSLPDGNFLAPDHDASLDTHYVQFQNMNFVSADVSFIWYRDILPWLELRWGLGVGLGVVLGDVLITNNSTNCTAATAGDQTKCYPISPTVGPIMLNQKDTESKLKQTEDPKKTDVAQDPHRHKVDVPPVLPVVNALFGVRFKFHKHVSGQLEMGFRDAFFLGAGVHYLF